MIKSLGVFCSAANGIDRQFFDAARMLGEWMGDNGVELVYGGANCGLMGEIARAVKSHGGMICGMVPPSLRERGLLQPDLDKIFDCKSLTDRKDLMVEHSDALLALPGGIGTLDEVFTVMGGNTIGYHNKMMILYNIDGFWNPLIEVIRDLEKRGFLRHPAEHYYKAVTSHDELVAMLSE